MTGKRIGATVLTVLVIGIIAACTYAWQPAIAPLSGPPAVSTDPTLLAEGARLTELGDCMQCHTAKGGQPYAGGLPLKTPFGTIYSTNLTPDAQTGIGTWSVPAFTRALRYGVSRDGHLLYPAFPYVHFTHLTDSDMKALYAYLMSRPPVHAPPRPNDLIFPLNFRPLVAGWNLLFLHPGALPAQTATSSTQWLRGQYLVEGLAHCASCHTPMNMLGGEDTSHPYAGGMIDGWQVPALTALSHAPKPWTHDQLVAYLSTGLASEHGAAAGPMRVVTEHLSQVPLQDIQAIASYVLSLSATGVADASAAPSSTVSTPTPTPTPMSTATAPPALASTSAATSSTATPATAPTTTTAAPVTAGTTSGAASASATPGNAMSLNPGASLFGASCAGCHGAAAPMRTIGGRPSLSLSTAVNADDPRNAIQMVLGGNGWSEPTSAYAQHYMPAFGGVMSDAQIADVLTYIRTHFAGKPAWQDLPATVAKIRKENSTQ